MKKVLSVIFTVAKVLVFVIIFTLILRMLTRHMDQASIGQGWRFMSFAVTGLFCGLVLDKLKLEEMGMKISANIFLYFLLGSVVVLAVILVVSNVLRLDLPIVINGSLFVSKKDEVFGWFLVAFGEEVLFRGYLLGKFKKEISIFSATILSSLLFCVLHSISGEVAGMYSYLFIFLIGMLLCRITIMFHSIWFGIGFHTLWNFLSTYLENTRLEYPVTIGVLICLGIVSIAPYLMKQTD